MSSAPSILALDLATRTGWAFATADAVAAWPIGAMFARDVPVIQSGVVQLKGGNSHLRKFGDMAAWLMEEALIWEPPFEVWLEAPVANPGKPKDYQGNNAINLAAQLAHGLRGIVMGACYRACIPVHERTANQIKQSLTGNGRADKAAMIRMCELRGWHPSDDNEADAMALLDLAAVAWRTRRQVA